jgi:hypothetical protein
VRLAREMGLSIPDQMAIVGSTGLHTAATPTRRLPCCKSRLNQWAKPPHSCWFTWRNGAAAGRGDRPRVAGRARFRHLG